MINDPLVLLGAVPALLVAFNEFLKKMGMPERWCPLVNVAGGFVAFPLLLQLGAKPFSAGLICLMVGTSAGGFFDLFKKTVRGE